MTDLEYSAMSQEQLLLTVQAKDAEIERLDRLITLKNRQLREYQDENAKLQAVVDAAKWVYDDATHQAPEQLNIATVQVWMSRLYQGIAALEEADDD